MSREEGTGVVEEQEDGSGQQGGRRWWISNEIRMTLIDHVKNHGFSFREVLYMVVDSTDF